MGAGRFRQQGVALIIVLGMLVLMTVLTMAFFSQAVQQRQISSTSSASMKVDILAASAEAMIVSDLVEEIAAGSEPEEVLDNGNGVIRRVFRPITTLIQAGGTQEPNLRAAPSMKVQPSGVTGDTPLVKLSRRNTPFFQTGAGYREGAANGQARASTVSTTDASMNGREIPTSSWNEARLLTSSDVFDNTPPDWIYIDRRGGTPVNFEENRLLSMSEGESDNPDFVLGRYAYAIYDVGGLPDINVIGNILDDPEVNARRGRLHQVDLPDDFGGDGVDLSWLDAFVSEWRSPVTGGDAEALFDPTRSFLEVSAGDQALLSRQDWIRYVEQLAGDDEELLAVRPLFTTFSRELNAPYWEPDPDRPRNTQDAHLLNPDLLSVRFGAETTLDRGSDPEVTIPAGTPVMPRRFPLAKLEMLENYAPDMADSVRYYFGLENQGRGLWEYVAGIEELDGDGGYVGTRIARLPEVAAQGREPNFFEVLQAAILTDSLGKHGLVPDAHGNAVYPPGLDDAAGETSHNYSGRRDTLRNLQVLQIGANIIDQWDADDIPTTIRYPSGDPSQPPLEVYGVENLPYINHMATVPFRPSYDRDLFQMWLLFDLWNPHQNAFVPPEGIGENLRIVVTGEEPPWATLMYWLYPRDGATRVQDYLRDSHHVYRPGPAYRSVQWDQVRARWPEFTVPAHIAPSGYAEPTEVAPGGGVPQEPITSDSTPPGLLLLEHNLGQGPTGTTPRPHSAAIAPKAQRSKALQEDLNDLFEAFNLGPYSASNSYTDNDHGERVYPVGTQFTDLDPNYWVSEPPVASDGGGPGGVAQETRVYANFPAKAHNHLQFSPGELDIELQAHVDGEWRTYQKIEGWFRSGSNRMDGTTESFITEDRIDRVLNLLTHHTEPGADVTSGNFYVWRKWFPELTTIEYGGVVNTLVKFDPRSSRFGLGYTLIDGLGSSLRNATSAWNRVTTNTTDWMAARGQRPMMIRGGSGQPSHIPVEGFETISTLNTSHPSYPYHWATAFAGFATNHPYALDGNHPARYADRDGVIRPGDAYHGARPTVVGSSPVRPVILNRPFRSVGDLGYVFRDLPWKTVDFSSRYSADLGLLDFFTLDEPQSANPVVAGKVNLNSASAEVLAALLRGSTEQLGDANPGGASTISPERAGIIADRIVAEREANGAFLSRGDLITRVFHRGSMADPIGSNAQAVVEREAAVRTLSEIGTLRTWNLMVDLVVQSGRFGPTVSSPDQFQVQGQRRYWIHLAVDRITGEVVDVQREVVER